MATKALTRMVYHHHTDEEAGPNLTLNNNHLHNVRLFKWFKPDAICYGWFFKVSFAMFHTSVV